MPKRSQRFDRRRRLCRARDYQRVFEGPCRSRSALFTVLARRNGGDVSRLGLAIGRKHVRGAVQRNWLKRVVRESFRTHQHLLRGLDVVVVGRRDLESADAQALVASLEQHWIDLSGRCKGSSPG
ncbi:MAG: ribonuclease P protein component [Gammaproteobacteria bacterium]|nr:ribonuclease P protein component [Gammaproteobacteria bacterium]NIR92032.1 ribonuclease P protein component [Gammaproteobacteria bacterium]NIT63721.1 ribonuclease P protein component [Gammaproteobacteria bacterium]NIV51900.1 ribonuclease P protein component [Gammaproteobacteria bacterium]NIW86493.1 ribonuclease P protein component [Gammaproteobacteria bacterium]